MENKQNYQDFLLKTIKNLEQTSKKPKLLLHACCAPCSTACLEVLSHHFDITIFFYNPNIHPKQEFDKRFDELKQFVNQKNSESLSNQESDIIKTLCIDYDPNEFFDCIKGLENEKEGGERCKKCFWLRLSKSAEIAKQNNFDYVTTTLTLSPYKNSQLLNAIGKELEQIYGVKYLFSDFKKNDGYKKSIELSKKYNLYRQDYCGCIFSKLEREQQKKEKLNSELSQN